MLSDSVQPDAREEWLSVLTPELPEGFRVKAHTRHVTIAIVGALVLLALATVAARMV